MKYIISRMLLLINSIIITVQLDDNDYNNNVNTLETTEYKEHDIPLLSEYLKYTTTYQEYSISTNICMLVSSILYIILYVYKFSVLFTIIEKATYYDINTMKGESINESININILKKIAEFTCHVLLDIVLIGLLIVPIKYNNIILNILCFSLSLFLFSFFFFFGFYINKVLPVLTFKEFKYNLGNIGYKLKNVDFFSTKYIFDMVKRRVKNIPFSVKNIKDIKNIIQYDKWDEKAYVLTDIIMIIMIILIIIGPIITKIITFWSEKGSVIKDIKNWISTSNIMRYILRNINIFKLPKGSTNITLSESIFSLFLSSITFSITFINHILPKRHY